MNIKKLFNQSSPGTKGFVIGLLIAFLYPFAFALVTSLRQGMFWYCEENIIICFFEDGLFFLTTLIPLEIFIIIICTIIGHYIWREKKKEESVTLRD